MLGYFLIMETNKRSYVTKTIPSSFSPETENALRKTDSYKRTWEDYVSAFSKEQLEEREARLIRRHAIETGILERLYDVSWGVTQSLVADGITADVFERANDGGSELSNPTALETMKVQHAALEMMVDFVKSSRPLSVGFIKELHAAMTKNQLFVDSEDQFGRESQMPLRHGEWKLIPNSVARPDGTNWQFVEPLFVQDEIERLVAEYAQKAELTHPIVLAAWIHYSFIAIHPFSDGNGRVARALMLLALLKGKYPPLVISRESRSEYIEALDKGNDGDLELLIRFFAKLEESTLLGELDSLPVEPTPSASLVDLAKAYAGRISKQVETSIEENRVKTAQLASEIQTKVIEFLTKTGREVEQQFQQPSLDFSHYVDHASPPEPKAKYYQGQVVSSAKAVGFYSNHADGTWWTCLTLRLNGKRMKFVTIIQKVGHGETGVIAVTVSAEEYFSNGDANNAEERSFDDLLKVSINDWVNMSYDSDIEVVWPEIQSFVDGMLIAAATEFFNRAL